MSNSIGVAFSTSSNGKSGFTTGGLGGLEAFIPGIGIPIYVNNNPSLGAYLGGGLKGRMPQPLIIHDNTHEFSKTRFLLRDAWNTTSYSGSSNPKRIVTPFRAVYNAGDLLSRQNFSCGGTCQAPQSRPNMRGLKQHLGHVSNTCQADVFWSPLQMDLAVPASACNTKFVYDGSDYIKFKKDQAINRNYNDRSFGGDDYSSSQSKWRAIRRY